MARRLPPLFALGLLVLALDFSAVKGRAFGSPLSRGFYSRASTAEADPQTKPGAPTAAAPAAEDPPLALVASIPLPRVAGRFDHFAIDVERKRLFLAALGNNSIEAIDLDVGLRYQSVARMPKAAGVVHVPHRGRLFIGCGGDGTLKVLDALTLKLEKSLTGFDDADNVRFDLRADMVYLGYGAGALVEVRAATLEITGRIPLAGHPESFQLEKDGGRIFVNIPDAAQIVVIDRERRTVTATWPMEEFRGNFPMALDDAGRRLFIGCRAPARLVVLDMDSGARVADLALSGDVDDLFYDSGRRRIYASCGEGFVDIVVQKTADAYERSGRIATAFGARTAFFSAERDEFYLAVPGLGQQIPEIRVYRVK